MTDQFAVVTVTYSSGDYLKSFLDTLGHATQADPRVVIADNGSTDGAPQAAQRNYDNVTLIETGANLGYGGAINRAVAEIDPAVEFIVVANPDVAWGPGSLDELLTAAQRWPRAGSLGPLIREPDGSVYPSARQVPKLISGTGHAVLGAVWKNNPFTKAYLDEERTDTERPVGWLSGSCLLLRREAFDAVSGFDSRYFMYMEDVDLGDRLGTAGWLNVFVPTAEILHTKGHAASKNPELMLPAHHRSAYQFQADRNKGALRAPLRWGLRAGLAVRSRIAVRLARRELDRAAREDGATQGGNK